LRGPVSFTCMRKLTVVTRAGGACCDAAVNGTKSDEICCGLGWLAGDSLLMPRAPQAFQALEPRKLCKIARTEPCRALKLSDLSTTNCRSYHLHCLWCSAASCLTGNGAVCCWSIGTVMFSPLTLKPITNMHPMATLATHTQMALHLPSDPLAQESPGQSKKFQFSMQRLHSVPLAGIQSNAVMCGECIRGVRKP
jgi:hypothetical protein